MGMLTPVKSKSKLLLIIFCTVFFDHVAERWSSVQTTGLRPPPSSFSSYTAVTSHHALLFGGHQPAKGYCTNDLFLMDYSQMVCHVHKTGSLLGATM